MTAVVALVVGNAVLAWHGHRALLWLADRRVDPTIVLTGWVLSTVGFVASAVATIALVALPVDGHHSSSGLGLAGECLAVLASGSLPRGAQLLAAFGLVAAAFVLARVGSAVRRRLRRRRRNAPHLRQLRMLAAGSGDQEPLWVQDDRPIALSIGGRSGLIVMSRAVQERLTPAAVQATLEHERAHLRGRHHLLVAVVETLAAALPWFPLLRMAPAATRDLVELAADGRAARRCGPSAVQEALCRLTGHEVPAWGLAMAGRLTETRLQRLARACLPDLDWRGCVARS